ncbi:hypothetical protein [Clostridium beijerinckii]|nr:hypothetical protein [Clostridium beijerinckii]
MESCTNFSPSDFRSTPGGICEGRMTELVMGNVEWRIGDNFEKRK